MKEPARVDLTPEERRAIKGALRRAFRQSPRMRDVLLKARVELPPALKKDGTPGVRNQVRYTCAGCKSLYPQKWVQVDHINPVVPFGIREEDMGVGELAAGIFCSQDNLQVLCSTPLKSLPKGSEKSCHAKKTNEENFIRKKLLGEGMSIEQAKIAYQQDLALKKAKAEEKERRKQERLQKQQLRKAKKNELTRDV